MLTYLETISYGVPLYYAGNTQHIIRLEPQKHGAFAFISREAAGCVAKKLAHQCHRDDFSVVEKHG
ncbi:hypothetical protein BAnh1_11080 [Bartonella australis AUST/NH1]|uniref:Uncharacterized protein n=1 Tax=Bartonella australis (strain Aust/NH1) TaxID=1094489 RepID=M1PED5_BARAA|nr:hypothetical protein [Bartonella australis]AGF74976.1 hypothetical protein BAnh1_11080 [Bartonella australis AUST/NH1]